MLDQLRARGVLRTSRYGGLELAIPPEKIGSAKQGYAFCDLLDRGGDTWSATGWALDPETMQSCKYVFPLQDGIVGSDVVFRRALRPDVNHHLGIDERQITGFSISFRPRPGVKHVKLIAVLGSGTLVLLPDPVRESVEQNATVLDAVTDLDSRWRTLCASSLYSFPRGSPYEGIYSFDARFNPRETAGVTDQFLDEAAIYHRRYTNHAYWTDCLSEALPRTGIDTEAPLSLLEIGCGSGNTVFPLLRLLPKCRIVASDISPQLLAMLRDQVADADRSRLLLTAMDASRRYFNPDSFHLVVGAAILHHMIDPGETLGACAHALKPGGSAIFFEPFESGHLVLRLLYEQLLDRQRELHLSDEAARVLRGIVMDCEVRKGADKSDEIYQLLDDKWLFTREYFEEQRALHGYSRLEVHPMHRSPGQFSAELKTHLRVHLDAGPEALTPEVWEFVRAFEAKMSPDLYGDLMIEAFVVLTK
jgi:SAM-dependent methyltransferase